MPGLYDQLLDQLGDDDNDKPAGLTPLDIADLPEGQRQVLFAMLRDTQAATDGLTLAALQHKLENLDGLPDLLADLTKNGWLILRGEAADARYKVNLRRKRGREVTADVWALLAEHLSQEADPGQHADGEPGDDSNSAAGKPRRPVITDW